MINIHKFVKLFVLFIVILLITKRTNADSTVSQIFVRHISGTTFSIDVDQSSTILDVKTKIKALQDVPIELQRLVVNSKILENDRRLQDYNIRNGETLNLILQLKGGMELFIQPLSRKRFSVIVDANNTIEDVKYKIQDIDGRVPREQRLIYAGKELQDWYTVQYYNLQPGAIIHYVLSIRGGV